MMKKRIGNIERILIRECVRDMPSFAKIQRLFDMGADPNSVNKFGESVLGIVMEGYCSLYGANLRSGFFAPMLTEMFIENGLDVRRFGLQIISQMQNSCYDRHMRRAIKMILKCRHECFKNDCKSIKLYGQMIAEKLTEKIRKHA